MNKCVVAMSAFIMTLGCAYAKETTVSGFYGCKHTLEIKEESAMIVATNRELSFEAFDNSVTGNTEIKINFKPVDTKENYKMWAATGQNIFTKNLVIKVYPLMPRTAYLFDTSLNQLVVVCEKMKDLIE